LCDPIIDEDKEMAEAGDDPLTKPVDILPKIRRRPIGIQWDF